MKKLFTLLVIMVYFLTSTGFTVCVHFCMDRFASAEIGDSQNDRCDKCGMHKDGGCCRDVVKVVKLQMDHVVPKSVAASHNLLPVQAPISIALIAPVNSFHQSIPSFTHDPPIPPQKIYIKDRVFRI